jgi:hypothetical protein
VIGGDEGSPGRGGGFLLERAIEEGRKGRRSKIMGRAENNNLIANRGLKSRVHRHTLLEECVDKGGFIFISSRVHDRYNNFKKSSRLEWYVRKNLCLYLTRVIWLAWRWRSIGLFS